MLGRYFKNKRLKKPSDRAEEDCEFNIRKLMKYDLLHLEQIAHLHFIINKTRKRPEQIRKRELPQEIKDMIELVKHHF